MTNHIIRIKNIKWCYKLIITTYEQQKRFVDAFAERHISLLILRGAGGIGKTFYSEQKLKDENCIFFKGHATPLSIYMTCLKNPKALIVFDDVDTLLNNKTVVALLKQLCDTKQEKKVYYSSSATYEGEPIPKEFVSRNKIMLLCNNHIGVNEDLKAVLTRGFYIHFKPSNEEIFRTLSKFAQDKQLLKELEKQLYKIPNFNFRLYEKCLQLKEAGLNYYDYLKESFDLVTDDDILRAIKDLPTGEKHRVWKNETGLSVRTLQRKLKELKQGDKK
jgi:uncharacterized protein YerC